MALDPPRPPRFLQALPAAQAVPFAFGPGGGRREPRPPRHDAPPHPSAAELEQVRREALERVGEAVRALRLEAEGLAEQARADAIEIAFQVASRILETEVRANPEALFALVRSALRKAGDSRRIAVRVSPEDAAILEEHREGLGQGDLAVTRVEVVPDPALGPGDCVVETDFGQVDGRLATRLSEARRAVRTAIDGGAA
jgi:flagellar assembly protein FliH